MKLILAVDSEGGLAKNGQIPWKNKEETRHFRDMTLNSSVVMGRKTFESMGSKPLPLRENIVVGGGHLTSYEEAKKGEWLIGGAQLTETLFIEVKEVFLSVIEGDFECDLFLPFDVMDIFNMIQTIYYNKPRSYTRKWGAYVYKKGNGFTVYHCLPINYEEEELRNLIKEVYLTGTDQVDRTLVGTRSIFGAQLKFSLDRFPYQTFRRGYLKGIFEEMMWFLRGKTDSKILEEKKIMIWKGNSSREALDNLGHNTREEGDCGPIYGHQWRHWGAAYTNCHADYTNKGEDQIGKLVHDIKNNPHSRRLIISGWNVKDLQQMCLPPCHVLYQFRVVDGKLSCHFYQRSSDTVLAGHWNITSAALLVYLLAKTCDLLPGTLTVSYGDVHIYHNQLKDIDSLLQRVPLPYPTLNIKEKRENIEDYIWDDLELKNYHSYPALTYKMNV